MIWHLATCTFIPKRENVVLLGPPGTGKTHVAIALGIKAAEATHPVLFDSATGWINRLQTAHAAGTLDRELRRQEHPRAGPTSPCDRLPPSTLALNRTQDYADNQTPQKPA